MTSDQQTERTSHVHIVPIATDERDTVLPITRDELPATEVIAYYLGEKPDSPFVEHAIEDLLGLPLTSHVVDGDTFAPVRELIHDAVSDGSTVYLNATELTGEHLPMFVAANTVQFERPEDRENIRVYVAGEDRYSSIPTVPDPDMTDTGRDIMERLSDGEYDSISQLAEAMHNGDSEFESFRSRIQYNTQELATKGYVKREKNGNAFSPKLTAMGREWVNEVLSDG